MRRYDPDYASELAEYAVEYLSGKDGPLDAAKFLQAIIHHAEEDPKAFAQDLAVTLRTKVRTLFLKAGHCPECGLELREVRWREAHPYGMGYAYEQLGYLECPVHGPVDEEDL